MLIEFSFAVLVVGRAVDLSSTQRCIGEQRCTEINHTLGRFSNPITFAVAQSAGTAVAGYGTYKLSKSGHRTAAIITNLAIGAASFGLGIHNYQVSKNGTH